MQDIEIEWRERFPAEMARKAEAAGYGRRYQGWLRRYRRARDWRETGLLEAYDGRAIPGIGEEPTPRQRKFNEERMQSFQDSSFPEMKAMYAVSLAPWLGEQECISMLNGVLDELSAELERRAVDRGGEDGPDPWEPDYYDSALTVLHMAGSMRHNREGQQRVARAGWLIAQDMASDPSVSPFLSGQHPLQTWLRDNMGKHPGPGATQRMELRTVELTELDEEGEPVKVFCSATGLMLEQGERAALLAECWANGPTWRRPWQADTDAIVRLGAEYEAMRRAERTAHDAEGMGREYRRLRRGLGATPR